jgi:hypothetical protein
VGAGRHLDEADIERFGRQCEANLAGETTEAGLVPNEPELCVTIQRADRRGHFWLEVSITSDHLAQTHKMGFEIDQSYLPGIIRACSRILDEYPVRRDE